MTDDALKHAFRRATAAGRVSAGGSIDADQLAALASGGGAAAARDQGLAAITDSALNADLLRLMRAIRADVDRLSADVQHARQPRLPARPRAVARRWLALAASIALAGGVGIALQSLQQRGESGQSVRIDPVAAPADGALDAGDSGQIMAASFEHDARSALPEPQRIFVGNFDS